MIRRVSLVFGLLIALALPLAAQTAAPDTTAPSGDITTTDPEVTMPAAPPPRTMIGTWEFSNADREKICSVIFRNETIKVGKRLEFDPGCIKQFPFIAGIAGWSQNGNDFLRLLDAQGNPVLEFSEVESGIFEAPKPGEGIMFIQNPTDLGPAPKTAEQVTGEWLIVRRTGQRVCGLTLSTEPSGEEFLVKVQPPCDQTVTRFGPATWQMDRGEMLLHSATGQAWRFEEQDDAKWHRIPETATPLLMVRK